MMQLLGCSSSSASSLFNSTAISPFITNNSQCPQQSVSFGYRQELAMNKKQCKVAVIGAGAAGLVTAKELLKEGHKIQVFEQSNQVGGTWVYDPSIEDDPLGIRPDRTALHGSMYRSLRTNLPRELMGFQDYPFLQKEGEDRDPRRFPGHKEVLFYLQDFVQDFELLDLIRFGCKVEYVGQASCRNGLADSSVINDMLEKEIPWIVRSTNNNKESIEEIFDAVVICNGHYSQPRIAEIKGISKWPGMQLHSHNYRIPEPFRHQVVVIIGNAPSGIDISKELCDVAKEVHLCARTWPADENISIPLMEGKLWRHPMIDHVNEDGTICFQDGTSIFADCIMHCTGYSYSFPFLDTGGIVSVVDNRVGPLYEHVFPPLLAPSLSFVGLPWKVIPFPLCELQAKWVSMVLAGQAILPSKQHMLENIEAFYRHLDNEGVPTRYTHKMDWDQFEYTDWLAAQCRCSPLDAWRREIFKMQRANMKSNPNCYRDVWTDHAWLEIALSSLASSNFKRRPTF